MISRWRRRTSLRSTLFAAFAGVLVLSLVLTAASFWLQISLLDAQRVRTDLLRVSPSVKTSVNRLLVGYWTSGPDGERPSDETTLARLTALRRDLAAAARPTGVRVLLTDYCTNVAIDSASAAPLRMRSERDSPWCRVLDDAGTGPQPRPVPLAIRLSVHLVQEATLPQSGTTLYLAFQPPGIMANISAQAGATLLLVRDIILAKSPGSVTADALGSILPRLAVAGAVAIGLTLLVVLLIVRAITRPLRTITLASERMARGDYDQRVPEGGADEVGQLARSFNRMASEVGAAREHQRQFIANVSHDLKTPLTSILGFSQILAESDAVTTDPSGRRAVQVINEEARRLQRLTRDLLDLSRLEAGQLPMRHGLCDLDALAGEALRRYAELPPNLSLTFLDRRAPGPLLVHGDPDRLMQVLVNLLDNAVKFCDPRGQVALETRQSSGEATLTVANTGAGIAPADLARVFQRFYRSDHSRSTRTGGTGLGLAIVREIVGAHGGSIDAHSDQDGWTRFALTLPVVASAPSIGA